MKDRLLPLQGEFSDHMIGEFKVVFLYFLDMEHWRKKRFWELLEWDTLLLLVSLNKLLTKSWPIVPEWWCWVITQWGDMGKKLSVSIVHWTAKWDTASWHPSIPPCYLCLCCYLVAFPFVLTFTIPWKLRAHQHNQAFIFFSTILQAAWQRRWPLTIFSICLVGNVKYKINKRKRLQGKAAPPDQSWPSSGAATGIWGKKKTHMKKCTRHKNARGSQSGGTRKHLVSAAFCLASWGEDPLSASKAPSETRLSASSSLEHARQLRRIKAGLCLCRKRKAPEFVRD